jgi:hypothetical protein
MRRSLLTIIVRAGMMYEPKQDNYEEALFAYKFVAPTRKAVMRFLFGFTKYVGPSIEEQPSIESRGWKSVFEGKDEATIKRYLTWPEPNPYIPEAPLSEAIWI